MSINLPSELHSPEQLNMVIIELRRYTGRLRDRKVRRQVARITGEPMPSLSLLATLTLEANQLTPAKGQGIEELRKALEDLRGQVPHAHLTLVELPDLPHKQEFVNWFRSIVHPHALLSFSARGDIGGGMLLRVGSHQYDFSFYRQLLTHKQRLPEILNGK